MTRGFVIVSDGVDGVHVFTRSRGWTAALPPAALDSADAEAAMLFKSRLAAGRFRRSYFQGGRALTVPGRGTRILSARALGAAAELL